MVNDQLMWCVLVYIKPISLTTEGDQNNSIEAHWYYSELHSRKPVLSDRLPYVTVFHCSLER
jgi:hypothetical protein